MTTPCKIAPETLTALHDGGLSFLQRWSLGFHCLWCWRCQSDLLSLASFDQKLQKFAAIPVEPRVSIQSNLRYIGAAELFMVDRRILKAWLTGILLIVALLGLGVWRFFTPEITWAEVEKAMSEVKTVQWRNTVTTTPGQMESSSFMTQAVLLIDPTFHRSATTSTTDYAYSVSPQRKIAITSTSATSFHPSYDTSHDYRLTKTLMFPKGHRRRLTKSVAIQNGQRTIAFSLRDHDENESFTIYVDPQTKRVLSTEHSWANNKNSAFKIQESNTSIRYNTPITQDFHSKSNLGNWDYVIHDPKEQKDIEKLICYFVTRQTLSNFPPPITWNYTISADIVRGREKSAIPATEEPILNIRLYASKVIKNHSYHYGLSIQAQRQSDGSFEIVPEGSFSQHTRPTEGPGRRARVYLQDVVPQYKLTDYRVERKTHEYNRFRLYL